MSNSQSKMISANTISDTIDKNMSATITVPYLLLKQTLVLMGWTDDVAVEMFRIMIDSFKIPEKKEEAVKDVAKLLLLCPPEVAKILPMNAKDLLRRAKTVDGYDKKSLKFLRHLTVKAIELFNDLEPLRMKVRMLVQRQKRFAIISAVEQLENDMMQFGLGIEVINAAVSADEDPK